MPLFETPQFDALLDDVDRLSGQGGAAPPSLCAWVLSADGAESAARLLVCARAAWVSEQVLIVELGPRAAGMQIQALFARLGHRRSDALRHRGVRRVERRPLRASEVDHRELPRAHLAALNAHFDAFAPDGGKSLYLFGGRGENEKALNDTYALRPVEKK